jgi:hypothetical protein
MLGGCRMNQAVYNTDGSRIVYMRPPLMRVVEELDERHLAAKSVCSRMNVVLRDHEKNKEWNLIGTYLGNSLNDMRLRITATGGQLVLDMSIRGDEVCVWLPRKNRYFRGSHQDLQNNQSQLQIFAHVGSCRDLFFPRAWSPAAIERRVTVANGREVVSVIEKPSFIRKKSRRLTLSPEYPVVEAVDVYDKYGREVGTLRYDEYTFPDPDEVDEKGAAFGLTYPSKITLLTHDGSHSLEMQVEEILINQDIDPAKFDVPPPDGKCEILDLGNALKHTGSLWE